MTQVDQLELSESHDEPNDASSLQDQPAAIAATDDVVTLEPANDEVSVEPIIDEASVELAVDEASVESPSAIDSEPEPAVAQSAVVAPSEAPVAEEAADANEFAETDTKEPSGTGGGEAVETASHSPEERLNQLETEVTAAPHKVYSLGKTRRVLAELKTAGADEALTTRVAALEAAIQTQIDERKSAKEAICERAEALQDSNEWRATGDKMRGLFEEWKTIGAAGKKLDDELWQRFIAARERFSTRRTEHFAERQKVWAVAKERKEALIAEAESLAESVEWRATAEKIRALQDQWKAAGSAGREEDDKLWTRFNAAKQAFFDNRAAVWDANKAAKEALCQEAEGLKESSDWRLTGDAMKAMQTRWKEIGPAGKAAEDQLWDRFRAATNAFFGRREQAFSGRRQDERENLAKKQELVAKIEALVYASDGLAAAREAKDLQAQWKAVGHVNREQSDALWARFRGACDRIFEAASSERERQQTEWHGRMKDAMTRKREQLVATRESIEHDEANLERWRAQLSELRPGGRTAEIEAGLDAKIMDVIRRIRAKNERVEELRATIADMEAKLRD